MKVMREISLRSTIYRTYATTIGARKRTFPTSEMGQKPTFEVSQIAVAYLTPMAACDLESASCPAPARGSRHPYKYRMALVSQGLCVMRYDNEAGKGDHRHVGDHEEPYGFTTAES
jgi:hypothetical protein